MSRKATIIALALAFGLFGAGQSAAQDVTVGVKGGINIADISVSDDDGGAETDTDTRSGFIGGGFLNIGLGDYLAIQPEFLYAQKGAKGIDEDVDLELKLDYFEIPVLIQLLIPIENSPVRPTLYAGPAISFESKCELEGTQGGTSVAIDCDEGDFDRKSTDFGAVFGGGLGFDVGQALVTIEGRYNLGLADINDTAGETTEFKNRAFSVMAGVGFRVN